MRQSPTRFFASLILGVFLVAPAHAGGDKDKIPQDIFKGYVAAMKKDDVKAMMSHMTRDSQSFMAAYAYCSAVIDKAWTGPFFGDRSLTAKEKEHIDAIDNVLKRHGLSEDALQKILEKYDKKPTTDEEKSRALGELVKDKPAFVTEMLKVSTARLEDPSFKEVGAAKLKEIKIDGQQAKGQATFSSADGKESTETIYFKLESGVWKIDLVETSRNWPEPPPPPQVQPHVQQQTTPSYSRPGPLRRLLSRLCNR